MRKVLLWVLAGCGLLSCSRYEKSDVFPVAGMEDVAIGVIEEDKGGTVRVSNDWLHFPAMEDFASVMKVLHENYATAVLGEWEKRFPGYVSLRREYELIDADDAYDRTAPTADSLINAGLLLDCPDSRFATVLNRFGRIQIADTLYQFLPGMLNGEAYAIPERYIGDVLEGRDVYGLDGVALHYTSFVRVPFPRWQEGTAVVVDPGMQFAICNFPSRFMFNWWGQRGGDIYGDDNGFTFPQDNGRTVKLNYHRWRVSYAFYSSVGVRVKMWKQTRFAGWLSNVSMDEASMEACVKGFTLNHAMIPIPFNERLGPGYVAYNTNNFERTLKWHADPLFSEIYLHHFNFRFRVVYRGRVVERFIRE